MLMRYSARSLSAILLLSGVCAVSFTGAAVRAADEAAPADNQAMQGEKTSGACDQTTLAAAKACHFSALADFWTAVGICDNFFDAGRSAACKAEADDARESADSDCRAQTAARNRVCRGVGQSAYNPAIDPSNFVSKITNRYLPLTPGNAYIYKIKNGIDTFFITRETIKLMGVTCVVVHDSSVVDGLLEEDTFDYFAQDRQGNVWYFGEDTTQLQDGVVVGVEGSWRAGVDGARPGLIMKAAPQVGDFYRQEFALGNAEDGAEVIALKQKVHVPFGSFDNALKTREFTALEPALNENKYYVPGVGNVLTIDLVTGDRDELLRIEHR